MNKRIAVVSDATSRGFWYSTWLQYYSGQFGRDAIHLVCYQNTHDFFEEPRPGNVVSIPKKYDDRMRAAFISSYVNTLLLCYDVVIRCDIDEILFPDFRHFKDLASYVSSLKCSHVTAIGFDVVQDYHEAEVDFQRPIFHDQRKVGVVYSSLHKTALTSVPTEWCAGFHGCTLQPNFDHLFLAHLKLVNFQQRVLWHDHMLNISPDNGSEQAYYSDAQSKLKNQRDYCLSKKRLVGWDGLRQEDELSRYLSTVRPKNWKSTHYLYLGEFEFAEKACLLPHEMSGII